MKHLVTVTTPQQCHTTTSQPTLRTRNNTSSAPIAVPAPGCFGARSLPRWAALSMAWVSVGRTWKVGSEGEQGVTSCCGRQLCAVACHHRQRASNITTRSGSSTGTSEPKQRSVTSLAWRCGGAKAGA